ncbi:hypothetical protein [Leptospira inadai]|uniref:hypothetical protein n=1 Tax=Leptospira inadai TaxID=29506 RepID=UPI00034647E1|nr:hypothetical protein [Leptospira inadai]
MSELRKVSESLAFDSQEAFNQYLAKIATHMGTALDGMGYGFPGWPGAVDQRGNLNFQNNIDCSSFVSSVLYAAGVSYGLGNPLHGYAIYGKDTMSAQDIANRDANEKPLLGSSGYGGVQNMRYNSNLFIPTPNNEPILGSIGMMMKYDANLGLYSDHTYVIKNRNNDTLEIYESAGGKGVQFSKRTQNSGDRYWNSKTTYWQVNPNYIPGLILSGW